MVARAGVAAAVAASVVALTGVVGAAALGAVTSTGTARGRRCVSRPAQSPGSRTRRRGMRGSSSPSHNPVEGLEPRSSR